MVHFVRRTSSHAVQGRCICYNRATVRAAQTAQWSVNVNDAYYGFVTGGGSEGKYRLLCSSVFMTRCNAV